MIASAKKNVPISTEYNEQPIIEFMTVNGSLIVEDYSIVNNIFVSDRDFERYGKIELYADGETRYFLKSFRGGRIGEVIPDPYGLFAKANDLSIYTDVRGGRFCEYLRVKKQLFEGYREYLKSRNLRMFTWVVQEILNGERL